MITPQRSDVHIAAAVLLVHGCRSFVTETNCHSGTEQLRLVNTTHKKSFYNIQNDKSISKMFE